MKNSTAEAGANQTICLGDTAKLTATGGVSYNWSNGATTDTTSVIPSFTTMYYVTVSNVNNCSAIDSVNVKIRKINPLQVTPDSTVICKGDTARLAVVSPKLWRKYEWRIDGDTTVISRDTIYDVHPDSTTIYKLNTMSICGNLKDSVKVKVRIYKDIKLLKDTRICKGQSVNLCLELPVPKSYKLFSWYFGNDSIKNDTLFCHTFTPDSTTNYTIISNQAKCGRGVDTVTVTVNVCSPCNIVANAGSDVFLCHGATAQLGTPPPTGTNYLYNWTVLSSDKNVTRLNNYNIAQPIDTGNNNIAFCQSDTIHTNFLVLTVTDTVNHCSKTDTVKVRVNPILRANAGGGFYGKSIKEICTENGVAILGLSRILAFLSDSINPKGHALKNDSCIGYDIGGDGTPGQILPDTTCSPSWMPVAYTDLCRYSYHWTLGDTITSPPQTEYVSYGSLQYDDYTDHPFIQPANSGIYFVRVKDAMGCTAYDSVKVNITLNDTCTGFNPYQNQFKSLGNNNYAYGLDKKHRPLIIMDVNKNNDNHINKCNLYPNPTENNAFIELRTDKNGTIEIYNVIGNLLQKYDFDKGFNKINLITEKYSNGVYLIKISLENVLYKSEKLIINK